MMDKLVRARVLEAARLGRISFYEGKTHEEIEFDADGRPYPIEFVHGVCRGCVIDAELNLRDHRCCIDDPYHRDATVAEVSTYLDGEA
jgi:hypothetical protein